MDEHRQGHRNQALRLSIAAETPSWSMIVKPTLPKVLRKDESKTTKHCSSVGVTHR